MKVLVTLIFISIKLFYFSQTKPCYQEKRICDYRKISDCNKLVSFDEVTETYYSKKDNSLLYSGNCVSCYLNGQLKSQITIANGKQDSLGLEYFESGCLQSIMHYISGKLDGEITFYYDSTNNKAESEFFINGIRNGQNIRFDNNSSNDTVSYVNYKKNLLDGIKKEFYPNNKIYRIVEYKNGLQNGSQKTYNNNGKLELELVFKNGKNHGFWHYYFDSGKEAKLENWNEGLRNGEFKQVDENGIILSQEFYKNNIPVGTHLENYPNGKAKQISVFDKKGIKIEAFSFDENGVKTEIIKNKKK